MSERIVLNRLILFSNSWQYVMAILSISRSGLNMYWWAFARIYLKMWYSFQCKNFIELLKCVFEEDDLLWYFYDAILSIMLS